MALRQVVGFPNLGLLPPLRDHAALAGEAIPKLPLIVAPSVGAPFVASLSLKAGSGAGCMGASYLSSIPPDAGNHTIPQDWHVPPRLRFSQCRFHHRRPRCLVLWLLVLELQPALYHHATVPPTLSSEGKALRYSPRLIVCGDCSPQTIRSLFGRTTMCHITEAELTLALSFCMSGR